MSFHIVTIVDTWHGKVFVSTAKNTATWRVYETMVFSMVPEKPDFSRPLFVNTDGEYTISEIKRKRALRAHREACQFYDAWSRRFAFDKNSRSYRPAGNS